MSRSQTFRARVTTQKRRVVVPVPFDPDDVWGAKPKHHVTGTVNGLDIRGPLERLDDPGGGGHALALGAAWRRDCRIAPGDEVTVVLSAEGPQRDDLADDIAAALDAEPDARAFFDGLATFYRTGYLRWIDATKRRPDVRAERIAEVVELCKTGMKERPR